MNYFFHLSNEDIEVLLLPRVQSCDDVFRPDAYEYFENVDVVDEFREARESDGSTWLLEVAQCALFQELLASVISIGTHKEQYLLLD